MELKQIIDKLKSHYKYSVGAFKPLSKDEIDIISRTKKIGDRQYNFDLPRDYLNFLYYFNGYTWQGTYCILGISEFSDNRQDRTNYVDFLIKNNHAKRLIEEAEILEDMDFLLVATYSFEWFIYVPKDRKYWKVSANFEDDIGEITAKEKYDTIADIVIYIDEKAGDGIFSSQSL